MKTSTYVDIDAAHGEIRKTRVYIASQYTIGDQQENVNRQIIVASYLMDEGFYPFIPLLYHYVDALRPRSYESWCEQDNVWVLKCDALLRLPGPSKGADAEVELAKAHNIPVFYSMEELLNAYQKHKKD